MPYEHRFRNRCGRKDCRHDPAENGIFIHGGTCTAGAFYNAACANRFGVTVPCRNKIGQDIDLARMYGYTAGNRFPTFQKAVDYARELQQKFPELQYCGIYACTDMQQDTTCRGKVAVQRILPPLKPNRASLDHINHCSRNVTELMERAAGLYDPEAIISYVAKSRYLTKDHAKGVVERRLFEYEVNRRMPLPCDGFAAGGAAYSTEEMAVIRANIEHEVRMHGNAAPFKPKALNTRTAITTHKLEIARDLGMDAEELEASLA